MLVQDKDFSKVQNKNKGDVGEILAAKFLHKKGFQLVEMNYKNKLGEIDIIAIDKGILVFIEVKSRTTLQFGRPYEAVDLRKQQKIRRIAELYLVTKHKYYSDCRFDIIEVLDGEIINHIINAF